MIDIQYKKSLSLSLVVLTAVLSLYFAFKAVSVAFSDNLWGSGIESTIVLSGHGEITTPPDVATVYFTIRKEAKTVKEAQASVSETEAKALDVLKQNNIEDKFIQASNASFYPKYEYKYDSALLPCNQYGCPPRPGKNVISGYEASETITVKIKDLDSVGIVMEALGTVGVTDLNGPNFEVDNPEQAKAEARKKAIDEAKTKAEVLARDLGVRLGKVVSFSENGNYYPMYNTKGAMAMDSVMAESAPAQVPKGENTISSDVTITYEIK